MPPEDQSGEIVEAPGMDMDAAVADIADALALPQEEVSEPDADVEAVADEPAKAEVVDTEVAKPEKVEPNSNDIAPDTWRKEAKEAWATVSPVVKEELRKRESDIAAYVEGSKQSVAVGKKLTEMITPYLPMFEKTGVDPWHNIGAMLQAQEKLLFGSPEEKLAMFGALAQQAGIKLENGQISAPPDLAAQHVARLEARLKQLEGGVHQVTSTVQAARQKELQDNVSAFAQDASHPHFFAVVDRITHLVKTGAASNLQEAYDTAVMADPVIRQQIVEAEAKRLGDAQAAAAKERLAKAKRSGVALVKSTQRGKAAQPAGSIDDTLEETLAAINSR